MKSRRRLLEKSGHVQWMQLTQLEEINSKLGAILLILTKKIGEEK
jgi:hypothetical protein